MKTNIISHIAAAIIITIISAVIYVTVQQNFRSSANDPQLQLARDIACRLKQNKNYEDLLPPDSINLLNSLGLFVQFYNQQNEPVFSTAILNGKAPKIPPGVLELAKTNAENSVTWQPQPDVRIASVVDYAGAPNAAYILVGRSLQEVGNKRKQPG